MNSKLFALLFLVLVAAQAEPFKSGLPSGKPAGPKTANSAPEKKPEGKSELEQRAENYYLKTYVAGSSGMRVISAVATAGEPHEIPGWPGRTRVAGSVRLRVTYKGRDQEETRQFEAILENGQVTEFTAR